MPTSKARRAAYHAFTHKAVTLITLICTLVSCVSALLCMSEILEKRLINLTLLTIPSVFVRVMLMDIRVLRGLCSRFEFVYLVINVSRPAYPGEHPDPPLHVYTSSPALPCSTLVYVCLCSG